MKTKLIQNGRIITSKQNKNMKLKQENVIKLK